MNKEKKLTIPQKIKKYLFPKEDEDLFKLVEETNNNAIYNLDFQINNRSVLTAMNDVPDMEKDEICGSALNYIMQMTFQPNVENKLFIINSVYSRIKDELNEFHRKINADYFIKVVAYNCLLWGQLPIKHVFSDKGILDGVKFIPDFTSVTPIIISGRTIGFIDEFGNFVPSYMYTYSQMDYYKNLGGNVQGRFVQLSNGETNYLAENEFTYANSYLANASKAWRNINMIEDALILNRLDQSNYYRIISVNVGGQVYSKSAIQTLNYYRNIFKKVRRVNYDSNGMSSKGNGQQFEIIVPKTQNQDIDIKDVGGAIDVKALKDLEVMYKKLFGALQIQASFIGFSEETPSSLGDSAEVSRDKRFAKVCKTVSTVAFNALRNVDYIYLRSKGYAVNGDEWNYSTVSQTMQEDIEKGEILKLAVDNLDKISEAVDKTGAEYDKVYLIKSILGGALGSFGIDVDKLMTKTINEEAELLTTSFNKDYRETIIENDIQILVSANVFTSEMANDVFGALKVTQKFSAITPKQLYSSVAVDKDTEIDLNKYCVKIENLNNSLKYKRKTNSEQGIDFVFPVYIDSSIIVTAEEFREKINPYVKELYIINGKHYLRNKEDLITYINNYMCGMLDNYCLNIYEVNK